MPVIIDELNLNEVEAEIFKVQGEISHFLVYERETKINRNPDFPDGEQDYLELNDYLSLLLLREKLLREQG